MTVYQWKKGSEWCVGWSQLKAAIFALGLGATCFIYNFFLNMDEIRHASGTQLRAHFHLINSKDRINDAFSKFLATKKTPKNIVTIQFVGGCILKR